MNSKGSSVPALNLLSILTHFTSQGLLRLLLLCIASGSLLDSILNSRSGSVDDAHIISPSFGFFFVTIYSILQTSFELHRNTHTSISIFASSLPVLFHFSRLFHPKCRNGDHLLHHLLRHGDCAEADAQQRDHQIAFVPSVVRVAGSSFSSDRFSERVVPPVRHGEVAPLLLEGPVVVGLLRVSDPISFLYGFWQACTAFCVFSIMV